jgi:DNA polymerase-3 subunit delta'
MIFEGKKEKITILVNKYIVEIMGESHELKIKKKTHPDIIYLLKDKKKKSIGIDEIRFIRENASIRPIESEFKIYVIHNANLLTEQAQNAILKILEEPPANVIFMLLCPNVNQLLPTLISRTTIIRDFDFSNEKINSLKNKNSEIIEDKSEALFLAIVNSDRYEILSMCFQLAKKRDLLKSVFEKTRTKIIQKCAKDINIINKANKLEKVIDLINLNVNINLISCFLYL